MKRAIIKESFDNDELHSGSLLVTPKSFNTVKDWASYQVEGLDYYVKKAISLGATKRDGRTKGKTRLSRSRDK